MCLLFALYFTAFSFSACYVVFFFRKIYAWTILFYAILWHEKRTNGEKRKNFWYLLFLFIFIISFSLNSFSRTRKIVRRKKCRVDYQSCALNELLTFISAKTFLCGRNLNVFLRSVTAKDKNRSFFAWHQICIMIINYIVKGM